MPASYVNYFLSFSKENLALLIPVPNVCQAICRHTVNETSDILIAKTEVRKTTEDLKRTTSSEPIQKFLVTMPTAEMTNEPKSRISTAGMIRAYYC